MYSHKRRSRQVKMNNGKYESMPGAQGKSENKGQNGGRQRPEQEQLYDCIVVGEAPARRAKGSAFNIYIRYRRMPRAPLRPSYCRRRPCRPQRRARAGACLPLCAGAGRRGETQRGQVGSRAVTASLQQLFFQGGDVNASGASLDCPTTLP
jgi:hypothetical protein